MPEVRGFCLGDMVCGNEIVISCSRPDVCRDVEGNKRGRAASEVFPEMDDVSPYFDYATAALENLKGKVRSRQGESRIESMYALQIPPNGLTKRYA